MSCTAAWNQKTFRGRNDDGNETTATWKATEGTDFSQLKDTNFRIRFEIQETAGCAGANKQWRLQYNRNGAGWNNVTATSSVVRASASPNLADAANLTNQLTVGTGTFQGATGFDEVDGICGGSSMDVAASGHSEAEFCVQIRSADVASGDTIQLRVTDNGTAFAAYDDTPSITVSSGNVTVTPDVIALVSSLFAAVIKHAIIVPVKALVTALFAPRIDLGVIPPTRALTLSAFAPTVTATANQLVTPSTLALTTTRFAPVIGLGIVPPTRTLTLTTFAPQIQLAVVPPVRALTISLFAPSVSTPRLVTPPTLGLTTSAFAPTVTTSRVVTPPTVALTSTAFAPDVSIGGGGSPVTVTPGVIGLTLASFAPSVTATSSAAASTGHGSRYAAAYWRRNLANYLQRKLDDEEEEERKRRERLRKLEAIKAQARRERARRHAAAIAEEDALVCALALMGDDDE